MRLIDADALKEAWKDVAVDGATLSYIYGLFKSVDDAPTIDAVPREDYISMERTLARLQQGIADATDAVQQGAWIENKTRTYCIRADLDTITCNKCGYDYPKCTPMFSREYCPNCGAKMDGERSE